MDAKDAEALELAAGNRGAAKCADNDSTIFSSRPMLEKKDWNVKS